MANGWKIATGIWGAFWAAVLVAATVPAKQAASNLASYAEFTGATWFVHLVATKGADHLAQFLSIVALVLIPAVVYASLLNYARLRRDGATVNGIYRRMMKRDWRV